MKNAAYLVMMGYLVLTWVFGRSLSETEAAGDYWVMPWVAVALFVLMPALLFFVKKYPAKLINFHGKDRERFKALDREGQRAVVGHVEGLIWFSNLHIILLFAFIQWTVWASAVGQGADWHMVPVLVVAFLPTPIVLIVYLPRMTNELKRQEARMRAQA